jgi:hypothetical protein
MNIPAEEYFWIDFVLFPHTSTAVGQLHSSFSQIGQYGSFTTFRLNRLSFVGKRLWHALQKKFLAAFGIVSFRRIFHKPYYFLSIDPCGAPLISTSLAK